MLATDTLAAAVALVQAGGEASQVLTEGTLAAPLRAGVDQTLSGLRSTVTLPLAQIDFLLFGGPVPLPGV